MKRIAVLTSGGDAPGMNAAIRAVARTAIECGVEVLGVKHGYAGLMNEEFVQLTARDVSGIIEHAGTVLGSARSKEFHTESGQEKAVRVLEDHSIAGLIVIGGNGSQSGALALSKRGVPVNGVASTIDNDLAGSDITIGVDSALNVALEAIDRLRVTATSHHRLFIVEVMGRDCGYLALTAGVAGGAEVIVTPEHDIDPAQVMELIHETHKGGKQRAMVVVAEGAKHSATSLYDCLRDDPICGYDPRLTILGHVQRGGRPSAFDRLLATRLAAKATSLLLEGTSGQLVGLLQGAASPTPLAEIVGKHKPLPAELLRLADTMKM
jgi:6-phosphofructokinase 1